MEKREEGMMGEILRDFERGGSRQTQEASKVEWRCALI